MQMRVVIVGQRDFGKAVLEAFAARGDHVVGVFCAPEKPAESPDPLALAAGDRGVPVWRLPSLKVEQAREALRSLRADIGVLAYVLQFVPQDFARIPAHGMIQYHPSLLPRYRGPSSINWPIILGDTLTGLTIFRPTDGLDEGPIVLQKETPIAADDTVTKVYFERLFPMGVAALLEAADLIVNGQSRESEQDETHASYQGWCRDSEALINWHNHVDQVYNLIRGCNPAPGAWTLFNGRKLQIFDARKHIAAKFSDVKGKIGTVTAIEEKSIRVSVQGGQIEVLRVRYEGGNKIPAPQFCSEVGVSVGTLLGV
jgi:methionyl-tRNA formyltransferase